MNNDKLIKEIEKKYPYLKNKIKKVQVGISEFYEICKKNGQKISEDYKDKITKENKFVAVILLNGGYMAGDITTSNISLFPVKITFLGVSRYKQEDNFGGDMNLYLPLEKQIIKNNHIVVFDDGQDEGKTYDLVYQYLHLLGAKSIELCTVINKPKNFKGKNKAKYAGKEISADFVTGGGFNSSDGTQRNIPAIYVEKQF